MVKKSLAVGCAMTGLILLSAVLPAEARSVSIDALTIEADGVDIQLLVMPRADRTGCDLSGRAEWFTSDFGCHNADKDEDGGTSRRRLIVTNRYILLVTATGRCASAKGTVDMTAAGGACEGSGADASSSFAAVRRIVQRCLERFCALASCCLEAIVSIARSVVIEGLEALFS